MQGEEHSWQSISAHTGRSRSASSRTTGAPPAPASQPFRAPGGACVWVEARLSRVPGAGQVVGVCVDITSRKVGRGGRCLGAPGPPAPGASSQLSDVLCVRNLRARTLLSPTFCHVQEQARVSDVCTRALDHISEGVWIGDASGRISWTNRAFTALTGYSEGEACGRGWALLQVRLWRAGGRGWGAARWDKSSGGNLRRCPPSAGSQHTGTTVKTNCCPAWPTPAGARHRRSGRQAPGGGHGCGAALPRGAAVPRPQRARVLGGPAHQPAGGGGGRGRPPPPRGHLCRHLRQAWLGFARPAAAACRHCSCCCSSGARCASLATSNLCWRCGYLRQLPRPPAAPRPAQRASRAAPRRSWGSRRWGPPARASSSPTPTCQTTPSCTAMPRLSGSQVGAAAPRSSAQRL